MALTLFSELWGLQRTGEGGGTAVPREAAIRGSKNQGKFLPKASRSEEELQALGRVWVGPAMLNYS